ncbi:hypothetical protein LSUE1_G008932 [Lachnellula suecica]|uniref:Uncharacterized protein n=1 Tax=Lachnellula suecica TaxID=602035 RepID=A0A8T9BSX4_9HELO|nr:hypothetical protein LSUE1_G008932 [Lachnellula suecica]
MAYIEELESEIVRLRSSKTCSKLQPPEVSPEHQPRIDLTLETLMRGLNGQLAPGLYFKMWICPKVEPAGPRRDRIVPYVPTVNESQITVELDSLRLPSPSQDLLVNGNPSMTRFEDLELPNPLNLHLENFDSFTQMLFSNFSENIAPTLVPIDGPSNGYRTMLLPLAYYDELVRGALLAASANHLRFKEPTLTKMAFSLQATSIERLYQISKVGRYDPDFGLSILATNLLLLIAGMMNGAKAFQVAYNTAKSWMMFMGETQEPVQSNLANFLRSESKMSE